MTDEQQQDPQNADFEAMLANALGGSRHDQIERAVEESEAQEQAPEGHRSGFVAVVGKPNVGKSTLMNQILGEKIAIVSPKPQTTRLQQLGILSEDSYQVIFVDTPGIHKSYDELGAFMVEVAKAALDDADIILFLSDVSSYPDALDRQVAETIMQAASSEKVIHVINKVDLARDPAKFKAMFEAHEQLLPEATHLSTVARDGHGVEEVLRLILERLPEGPIYYPRDQVSDLPVRSIAAEMVREQVLRHTRQEVPHAIAVEVESFKQRDNGVIYIQATIYTERDGQKGIIIGKGGEMLKRIATDARQEIEAFVESRVFLELYVKVLPNWRSDPRALQRFGYRLQGDHGTKKTK